MQLFAQDENNRDVLATDATKRKDYTCPECHKTVRLRKGPARRPHFFHRSTHPSCRQHKKSWKHLQLQLYLLNLLPEGEALIEKPYPSIQRIADVSWEKQGIIFEIQCSPINLIECMERNEDYKSLGLTPVWILHDFRFNRRYPSGAENHLRKTLSFFAHIDKQGTRKIYDQFEIIKNGRRLYRSPPLPVNLSLPFYRGTHITFQGSLPHRLDIDPSLAAHFSTIKASFEKSPPSIPLTTQASKKYSSLLYLLLELFSQTPS